MEFNPSLSMRYKNKDMLTHAIKQNENEMIKILLENGAEIGKRHLLRTFKNGQTDIAKLLFDELNKHPELLQNFLYLIFKHAPAEFQFEISPSLLTPARLTMPVNKKCKGSMVEFAGFSATVWLECLLKNGNQILHLLIIRQIVQHLLLLEHFPTTIESEPCYANIEKLEELKNESGNSPLKEMAKELLISIKSGSEQGRIISGLRILNEILLQDDLTFADGKKFIRETISAFDNFYENNKYLPKEDIKDKLESIFYDVITTEKTYHGSIEYTPEAKRFSAMSGSSVFSATEEGGNIEEAATWYSEIITTVVHILKEMNMLADSWDVDNINALITEISEYPSSDQIQKRINTIANQERKAIGFNLDVPEHFIPACLYRKDKNNWVYTVICRSYIQPLHANENYGALDFIIPHDQLNELLIPLVNEIMKDVSSLKTNNIAAAERATTYILLSHCLAVEKLTNVKCVYSERAQQKNYKGNTCFASNFKGVLPIIFSSMIKNDVSSAEWENFNRKLKDCILVEIDKASLGKEFQHRMEAMEAVTDITISPRHQAYKLITTLLRWTEINKFNPASSAEINGKEAVKNHVLNLTEKRFQYCCTFFNESSAKDFGRECNDTKLAENNDKLKIQ